MITNYETLLVSNKMHFYNAKVDVMYGINIFTLTFPLYKKSKMKALNIIIFYTILTFWI
ncbi:hypothetical protein [Spiroplasma endosymbiont of Agriotes lineatus]|uniref:hypothetical protein n=1 Tax=Spiroplasma endosymbiont of Agriotes lineatus TaxID=3077930 RepID=UPI0030D1781E